MRTPVLALVALACAAHVAQADVRIQSRYLPGYGWTTDVYHVDPTAGLGKAIRVAPDPVAEERIRKWEAFCQPVAKPDANGVQRYTYAHDGCDTGRSE